MKKTILNLSYFILLLVSTQSLLGQNLSPKVFEKPSSSEYGPYTFWMWIQDHATKEGAKKDLEAMASKGYAGAYIFNLGINDGLFSNSVPKLNYMSKEWFDVVSSAMKDAQNLGLKMGMHNCSGWSHTGTMDITPEEAMKTVTYSKITIKGGEVNVKLPSPMKRQDFYRDIAILAYPISNSVVQLMNDVKFKLSSNVKINDAQAMYDGSISTSAAINPNEKAIAKLVFAYEKPIKVSALKISDDIRLQVLVKRNIGVDFSNDGINFTRIPTIEKGITQGYFTFKEVEASYFRVVFEGQTTRFLIPEIEFINSQSRSNLPKLCDFEIKAGYAIHRRGLLFGENVPKSEIIDKKEVINLTKMLKNDSLLVCKLPIGKWEVIRIGYTITGRKNSAASISGSGLEVDKASKKHMDSYFEKQPQKLINELKEFTGKTFRNITTDSWEANVFNWTDLMAEEFLNRRGYDISTFLPALTGEIIESTDITERFLLDFRKTLAELINENCYQHLAEKFKLEGMNYVSEASGAQQFMGRGITYPSHLVEPWTEFWVTPDVPFSPAKLNGGFLDAISSGHIYNKNIIAAESFTSGKGNWKHTPYDLKPATDAAFALGINKIVFHTYVHQPDESVPGWQMNPWGVAINRKLTWWEQSNSWIQYISRCHYLLRQGQPQADVLAFSGEDIGISMAYEYSQDTIMEKSVTEGYTKIEGQFSHITPYGYAWDGCDIATLTSRLTVKNHQLHLPNGISYKLLILPPNQNRVSPKLLQALKNLIQQGAIVYGKRPENLSTLEDYPNCDIEAKTLIREIWGEIDGKSVVKNILGKGSIYFGVPIKKVLNEIAIKPDFSYKSNSRNADIIFNHRKSETEDIYFVANQNKNAEEIICTFRVFDKQPQLWDAITGQTTICTQFTQDENGITLTLPLESFGSMFVIFTELKENLKTIVTKDGVVVNDGFKSNIEDGKLTFETSLSGNYVIDFKGKSKKISINKTPTPIALVGQWKVAFTPGWGAPQTAMFETLNSWSKNADKGIKYYSGTACYSKDLNITKKMLCENYKLTLDLGEVRDLAEIIVNDKNLGVIWKPPFRVDITTALNVGNNKLEIKVTNVWVNRLIGDEVEGGKRYLNPITRSHYDEPSEQELFLSGLLGPVLINTSIKKEF